MSTLVNKPTVKLPIRLAGLIFFETENVGLIRNFVFFPIELKNYCGSY